MRRRVFVVDMENISSNALVRQAVINKRDVVYLVCSRERKINEDNRLAFEQRKWNIVDVTTKIQANSLDFQLSCLVGALLASNDNLYLCIMSKDKGYDSVVRFFNNTQEGVIIRGHSIVKRFDSFDVMKNTCTSHKLNLTGRKEVNTNAKEKRKSRKAGSETSTKDKII